LVFLFCNSFVFLRNSKILFLGPTHINLILRFADELFDINPQDCLKIFTADTNESESLDRNTILNYLQEKGTNLVTPYLEHLIFSLEDKTEEFHNTLAILYKDLYMKLHTQLNLTHSEDVVLLIDNNLDVHETSIGLVEARSKLTVFLEISKSYNPQCLLSEFPEDMLHEERALILGKQGSHEKALAIYIFQLHNTDKAEHYCTNLYEEDPENNKIVFLSLFKMFLQSKENFDAALRVLHKHSDKLDPIQAILLIPECVQLNELEEFICTTLKHQSKKKHQLQMLDNLLMSENLQVQRNKMIEENVQCRVTKDKKCGVCGKQVGNSAFARYPNDVAVHLYCRKNWNYTQT